MSGDALTMQLGQVATWTSGSTPKATEKAFYGGDVPWVTIGDMTGTVVTDTAKKLSLDGLQSIGGRVLPVGAVLCSMYGTVGKTAMVGVPLATNQAIAAGVANADVIDPTYLYYAVSERSSMLDSMGRGATQRNINRRQLEAVQIRVPPRVEQQRIVELLSSADAMVEALHQEAVRAHTANDELLEALIGAVDTSMTWSQVATMSSRLVVTDTATQTLLGVRNAHKGLFVRSRANEWQTAYPTMQCLTSGQLVIGKLRAQDGGIAVAGADHAGCVLSSEFLIYDINPEVGAPEYLKAALKTTACAEALSACARGTGNGKERVTAAKLAEVLIPVPSLGEQKVILDALRTSQARASTVTGRLHAARTLRAQLLQDLLSGNHAIPESYDRFLEQASA